MRNPDLNQTVRGRRLSFVPLLTRIGKEAGLITVFGANLLLLLALVGYDPRDPGWSHLGYQPEVSNFTGPAGAWLADLSISAFGIGAYVLPLLISYPCVRVFFRQPLGLFDSIPFFILRTVGILVLLSAACALVSTHITNRSLEYPFTAGGLVGESFSDWGVAWFSVIGASVFWFTLFLFGCTLYLEVSWQRLLEQLGGLCCRLPAQLTAHPAGAERDESVDPAPDAVEDRQPPSDSTAEPLLVTPQTLPQRRVEPTFAARDALMSQPPEPITTVAALKPAAAPQAERATPRVPAPPASAEVASPETGGELAAHARKNVKIVPLSETHKPMPDHDLGVDQAAARNAARRPARRLPAMELLDPPSLSQSTGYSESELEEMSRLLEDKLKDFGVIAEVVEVNPGPVITRFEIQPAPGVKASKISNLAKDLARSMAVSSVRVVEVIAGKSVVGIEIPNAERQTVQLSEVLNSKPYLEAASKLSLGLGNDIAGNPVVTNLAKMPHLLVAGTTGSGKSVGVNAMLLSLLFKATPDEVRLIMVDPKMLELSIYDGIPHLLTPVITDMKDAAAGLRWCVAEMERRYRLMAKMGVRNIAGFNEKVEKAQKQGQPIKDPLWNPEEAGFSADEQAPDLEPLPYIVVVIDEFADMMMIVGKKVEELIARIAQKARAAGIHLILATQRPSVDVITGLIKANIPTRIAFQVSSKIDSRTILDQSGAENLLGYGDMLYLPAGTSLPNRVHGAFVSDDEVHRVVEGWKKLGSPVYIDEILSGGEPDAVGGGSGSMFDDEQDPLYDEAVAFVTETRKASISSVQRKLKIGYNRAARMIETMEAAGVVSPAGSNGQRDVLAPPPVGD